jgi:hypothetical protein
VSEELVRFIGGPFDGSLTVVTELSRLPDRSDGYVLFVCIDGSYAYLWETITKVDTGDQTEENDGNK